MLENLKRIIGLSANDTDLDEKLTLILNHAKQRLQVRLGGIEPPAELEYIVIDVAAARYNRLGSEGLTSHSVEGESFTFSDGDFANFTDDIQAYLDSQKESTRGKVRFL